MLVEIKSVLSNVHYLFTLAIHLALGI